MDDVKRWAKTLKQTGHLGTNALKNLQKILVSFCGKLPSFLVNTTTFKINQMQWITEEIGSCDFEPPDGATLEP